MSANSATLRDLIEMASKKHGTTAVKKLAKIAQDAGFPTNHTTIASIRAGKYPSKPTAQTLDALAYLAGVPKRIAYAAGDLPYSPSSSFASQLPRDVDILPATKREPLLSVIKLIVDQEKALSDLRKAKRPNQTFNTAADDGPEVVYVTEDDLNPSEGLPHSDEKQM